jgi:hypothetical protein
MMLYMSLDATRFFAIPEGEELPPGDTVVRRPLNPPERSELDALSKWEISRQEGLALAKSQLDTTAMSTFEAQILDLQAQLQQPETRDGLRKVAAGLKKLGLAARERRLAREARRSQT